MMWQRSALFSDGTLRQNHVFTRSSFEEVEKEFEKESFEARLRCRMWFWRMKQRLSALCEIDNLENSSMLCTLHSYFSDVPVLIVLNKFPKGDRRSRAAVICLCCLCCICLCCLCCCIDGTRSSLGSTVTWRTRHKLYALHYVSRNVHITGPPAPLQGIAVLCWGVKHSVAVSRVNRRWAIPFLDTLEA